MKASFIATSAIASASRQSIMTLQAKLAQAQKEVASGRFADVGLSLGYKTGESVSLRQEMTRLQTITDTNGLVSTRLVASQSALKSMADDAQSFLQQLIAARDGGSGAAIVTTQAKAGLASFTDALNTSVDGAYLFSGINADVKPLTAYDQDPPSAAQDATAAAFQAAFGMAQSDPGVSGISAADMQTFLDGAFAGLFDDGNWSANWSSASDQNIKSRISSSELVDASTNANAPAFRQLASAYAMVADLNVQDLDSDAYKAVIDQAIKLVGGATQGLTGLQADLGTAQERVAHANDRMSVQIGVITNHIGVLEGVDPAEASTRIASLMTQIETAYAMTARLQQLSLLNYLPVR
jgi:flagellar hook-associated protein 3 FlgL